LAQRATGFDQAPNFLSSFRGARRASPESMIPVVLFILPKLPQGVWIPGLRQAAHPGMTRHMFVRPGV
jgi:hypothetical protein